MKRFFVIVFLLCFGFAINGVSAGMSSTNFLINWDSMNTGGNDASTSTNFGVRDTIGDIGSGTSTSANYQLAAGYRSPEGGDAIAFVIKTQTLSTQAAYTGLNIGGKTVTLSAVTTTYAIGDFVAVVENLGYSQLVVVGKIMNVAGAVLTVDKFDGATGSMSAVPAGGDDFVFRLSNSSVAFGSVVPNAASTAVAMSSVLSSVSSGYTVYVQANQQLQNGGAQVIASVADGAVSIGSEEYGASVTGTRSFLPDVDMAVTTTQRAIQSSASLTVGGSDRVPMNFKLSVVTTTNPGVYSQNVYYTMTANY